MNNKIALLVGVGANQIKIPCVVFPNFDAGMEHVKGILGSPNFQGVEKDNRTAQWDVNFEDDGEQEHLSEKFFTSYYDGCGECYRLNLREVDFGVPLVGWNLD